ncbi:COG4223 family protein [Rhodobacter lacus]|uniref:COG4223 family protein n=1 Tax=Rhodobacter lacus TaxID=1641972 RepID=A0ABW5A3W9_9RHOB
MAKPETDETETTAATSAQDPEIPSKEEETPAEAAGAAEDAGIEEAIVVDESAAAAEAGESRPEMTLVQDPSAPEPETAAEEAPAPVAPKKPEPPPKRRGLSVVLGGVIAAVIGAGVTLGALPNMPADLREKILPAGGGARALEEAIAAQDKKITALEAKLAQAPEAGPDVAALEAQVADLSAKLSAVESAGNETAQAEIDALKAELVQMREDMKKSPMYATQQQLDAATTEAKARIAEAEAEAAKMRAETEAAAQRAIKQAAVSRVAAAFDTGAPLARPVAEVEAAGMTVPAALKSEVPSAAMLQETFPDAARAALAVARKVDAGDSVMGKLGTFLLAQTGARSLTAREGNSPDAVLSRAQAAVDDSKFETAVAELAALPEQAQAEMTSWKAMVEARMTAQAAISELAQSVQ